MNTFLPYPDFEKSARCLDNKRLGKQRVETYQILNTLTGKSNGWKNHPAVKMWRGFEWQLYVYGIVICREWQNRGYKDSVLGKLLELMSENDNWKKYSNVIPPWLWNEDFHAAMRSNLLRKDPVWYGQFNWKEDNTLPYVWPIK